MNLLDTLNIKTETVSAQKTILVLNVSDKIKQPFGFVHGGINAVLAETAASMGANTLADTNQAAFGLSITTNHLLPVSSGTLKAIAHPIHIGKRIQVWQVKIIQYPSTKVTSVSTVTISLQKKFESASHTN
ncbi:PaaI family thioesterase [Liquorilactobacillus oeni]|uniref:Thioesterase domain-containing protein n=1 Tax=Liquorilactobacillus oeni DSM 19972 TaxID=1423777 RepID=A0A0R1MCL9_9LACO|nr:hotdog fold thioesterase [Liquorilactobacillus oeni]KRL05911.1 hypothetical protein FD46_GL000674 [Liquorilactobacillus oeni DSM 19972]